MNSFEGIPRYTPKITNDKMLLTHEQLIGKTPTNKTNVIDDPKPIKLFEDENTEQQLGSGLYSNIFGGSNKFKITGGANKKLEEQMYHDKYIKYKKKYMNMKYK